MTIRELIMALADYNPDDEVVVIGHVWRGINDPEEYESEPTLVPDNGKVRIIA
jgi:hypothetical protein